MLVHISLNKNRDRQEQTQKTQTLNKTSKIHTETAIV